MTETYCLLTGGICGHSPIHMHSNSFFLAEPFDAEREKREASIKNGLQGHKLIIADNDIMNIAITCKICRMIRSCEYGIVDISGLNNNVLIELGMLYGLNKPTIILVKKGQAPDFKIPSNIKGLEQIRYTEYSELESKLSAFIPNLYQMSKRTEDIILDYYPILRNTIKEIDLAIYLKQNKPILGKIIEVKIFEGFSNLIVNIGKDHGVMGNMLFDVYLLEPTSLDEDIEYHIGTIQPINIQKGLSQYIVHQQRVVHPFWEGLIRDQKITANHLIKSKIPSIFLTESIVNLNKMRETYNEIIRSIQMVNS